MKIGKATQAILVLSLAASLPTFTPLALANVTQDSSQQDGQGQKPVTAGPERNSQGKPVHQTWTVDGRVVREFFWYYHPNGVVSRTADIWIEANGGDRRERRDRSDENGNLTSSSYERYDNERNLIDGWRDYWTYKEGEGWVWTAESFSPSRGEWVKLGPGIVVEKAGSTVERRDKRGAHRVRPGEPLANVTAGDRPAAARGHAEESAIDREILGPGDGGPVVNVAGADHRYPDTGLGAMAVDRRATEMGDFRERGDPGKGLPNGNANRLPQGPDISGGSGLPKGPVPNGGLGPANAPQDRTTAERKDPPCGGCYWPHPRDQR